MDVVAVFCELSWTITLAGVVVCFANATSPAKSALPLLWGPCATPVIAPRRFNCPMD